MIFQFLYGAIKRQRNRQTKQVSPKFQFLYGAIKRNYTYEIVFNQSNFNSSMVRLKGIEFEKLCNE